MNLIICSKGVPPFNFLLYVVFEGKVEARGGGRLDHLFIERESSSKSVYAFIRIDSCLYIRINAKNSSQSMFSFCLMINVSLLNSGHRCQKKN